jgi:UDP-N-acetylmuramate dehydrogenase
MWEIDVPLADLTRYRIGGPASRFARLESREALGAALESADGAYRVLGWGANVLVADRGVSEAVIVLSGQFDFLRLQDATLEAGAAAGLPAVVGEARRAGRGGWEFLEAVPGSVGGGLRMNAGSTDTGLWDRAIRVDAMTPEGATVRLTRAEARPAYRTVGVPDDWVFLDGEFEARPGDPAAIEMAHRMRRARKVEAQVYELPSCGSIWKNPGPPHGAAWQLVVRAGMRGARKGNAQITERHANFIANLADALAADVLWLMAETRRRVHEKEGVWLEPEIRLWGFDPEELASVGAAS